MKIQFKILENHEIEKVIPLVDKLNDNKVSIKLLKERFAEMIQQNYECAVIMDDNKIVGVSGLWFCTRHYIGKSVELDHVYIEEEYRNKGLGNDFMKWIQDYTRKKGCNSIELNTYVQNFPSHKFYYNQGFNGKGYHFQKIISS
ncbi:hypothetical protein SAMN03097699_1986 [Flavobacteriaceae bacterium MAR_2010_188]|nr:hypothetical protein SAMN03097699_1986 [Flavobacteriaceae bacterium MAR_2010_188]